MGKYLADPCPEARSFTLRSLLVGLAVGILICFSNTFFGLQTGWISAMTMPASLIGFAVFKTFASYLSYPFTPAENVLVQTVAGAVGTMPLGCGFVGVVPALEFLLTPAEGGPVRLGLGKLVVWALGLSLFGVVFAVPLRKQVIVREKLRFPTGTATALMIGVLHGRDGNSGANAALDEEGAASRSAANRGALARPSVVVDDVMGRGQYTPLLARGLDEVGRSALAQRKARNWKRQVQLLAATFTVSAIYTLVTYFVPQVRRIPFLGVALASNWLWTFNLSPAYIAQGIIMGPTTTSHMLVGAVVGWAILSPLAKLKGWAPGPVGDWGNGSRGWIVWTSLAIMLVDALVSLGWLAGRPLVNKFRRDFSRAQGGGGGTVIWRFRAAEWSRALAARAPPAREGYRPIPPSEAETGAAAAAATSLDYGSSQAQTAQPQNNNDNNYYYYSTINNNDTHSGGKAARVTVPHNKENAALASSASNKGGGDGGGLDDHDNEDDEDDVPPSELISNRAVIAGLVASLVFCAAAIRIAFGALVPLYATAAAIAMALLLAVMGVRAQGETDLNPVSGISKLTQLVFALLVPAASTTTSMAMPGAAMMMMSTTTTTMTTTTGANHALLVNLVAGAVSEAGALQAGDMMQDLKTGHLLAAAPRAQFWGQLLGSVVGAAASAGVYRLYTRVYAVPGELFQIPTGYVWIFTARLVTGQGLPPMAREVAVGAAVLYAVVSVLRIYGANSGGGGGRGSGAWWLNYLPGGIAVAVGMYNVPSFTLARAVGGFINWYCLAAPSRAAPSPSASSFASPHTAQSGVPQSDPPRPRHQPSPSGSNASGSGSGSGGGGGGGGGGSGSSGESSSSRDAHPNGGDSSSSSSSSSKNNENNGDVGSATVDGDGDGDGDTNVFGSSDTETRLIVLASGLILGEGVFSIVNLVLASLGVPHL